MTELVIELLLKQVEIFITNEFNLHRHSKKAAKDLVQNLEKLKLILNDAESKQLKNPLIKLWLEQLQNFAYDVEDAFDDRLEAAKNNPAAPQGDESLFRKVCVSTKSIYSRGKGVLKHRSVAREIIDLNERIKEIYIKGNNEYQLIIHNESQKKPHPNDRMTTSGFIESHVYGRKKDKDVVKAMLMSLCNDEKEKKTIPVVSIVGAGGLGKTTLAKMVYKELESDVFPKKIWVCVSDPFDQIAVAKQILEQLGNPCSNISGFEALTKEMVKSLKDSKFLLVLDDVWIEEPSEWDQLNACLSPGVKGSVILVTTRKLSTAEVVFRCDDRFIHNLQQVDSEVCWAIISQQAFSLSRRKDPQLEAIGKEIAKKCAGSPLAAKVLGGLLLNKSVQDWQRVLHSEIWQLGNVEKELFPSLFLSYDELDPAAKRCFSFCAVFPKDFELNVEKLIRMWMAQGFLSDRDGQMEVEGQRIFDYLSQRSFFQDFQKHALSWHDSDDRVAWCKMHDIVHDFAQFLTKDECVVVANRSINEISLEKTRHLSWLEKDKPEITLVSGSPILDNAAKLRTFLCEKSLPSNFLKHLKCVRELMLRDCDLEEIPEEIGNLIHLRYLDLSENRIKVIPQGICNLSKLQTLDLKGFNNKIRELPEEMGKLVKLRHFSMSELIISGLEGLHDLRTLNGEIWIRKGGENKLGCLAKLNQLEGHLKIILWELDDVEKASKAALMNMKYLQSLELSYGNNVEIGEFFYDKIVEIGVVEALQPNPELMCLWIHVHMLPKWITNMKNLRKLRLSSVSLNELGSLWKLPFLVTLYISYSIGEKLGREFLGLKKGDDASTSSGSHVVNEKQSTDDIAFPSLKTLTFRDCYYWREWEYISEEEEANNPTINIFMPHLTLLEVLNCHRLNELPHRLLRRLAASSLQTLKGFYCPGVRKYYDGKSTEQGRSKASHISNVQILYTT